MLRLPCQLTSSYSLIQYAALGIFWSCVYPSLRRQALETEMGRERLLSKGYTSLTHEQEVLVTMCLVCVYMGVVNRYKFWYQLLLVFEITTVVLTWLTGDRLVLFAVILAYATMHFLLKPPSFHGDSNIRIVDKALDEIRNNEAKSCLLVCHLPWNTDCCYLEPILSQLSVQFNSQEMKFYSLDLSDNPQVATELEIDMTGRSKQLPTLILFHRGEEIRRLPSFKGNGKIMKTPMSKKHLVQYFELDQDAPSYRRESLSKKR